MKAISASGQVSLALLKNGTVMAWGDNTYGELGNGTNVSDSNVPVTVTGLSHVKAISAGGQVSLAMLKNGTVMAWGDNLDGELGNGTNVSDSNVPVTVTGLSSVKAISAGGSVSLAMLKNGTVMAWGDNTYGELGNGTNVSHSNVPVAVAGLRHVKAISAGGYHSLAVP